MYLIRRAKPDDLDILLRLARTVHFINLPPDREIISEKISRSRASFQAAAAGEKPRVSGRAIGATKDSPQFMFVLADDEGDSCHGTSSIIARMGAPGHPNLSFELRRREFFSKDLQTGTTHMTVRLHLDETGPSEIGGLVLAPTLRKHPERLGKQLSLVRFHYIGLHPEQFSDHLIAEMMAPISSDGRSEFWEALGRRFINLSYTEADRFSQHSREFMLSLLPREEIFVSLLPPEARHVIGQVGPETAPARKMLEDIGFRHTGRIDPFDGGPHLECKTADIPMVRDTRRAEFAGVCPPAQAKKQGFVSVEDDDGEFRAMLTVYCDADSGGVRLLKEAAEALHAEPGTRLGITPMGATSSAASKGAETRKQDRNRSGAQV